jgi:hypothetical protein
VEAVVSTTPAGIQNVRVDAFADISYADLKLPLAVVDLHVYSRRASVPESIAQRFFGNARDLIADERRQIPGCPFHTNTKVRSGSAAPLI